MRGLFRRHAGTHTRRQDRPLLVTDLDIAWARRTIREYPARIIDVTHARDITMSAALLAQHADEQHRAARVLDRALRQETGIVTVLTEDRWPS